jgi:hypothetical protein
MSSDAPTPPLCPNCREPMKLVKTLPHLGAARDLRVLLRALQAGGNQGTGADRRVVAVGEVRMGVWQVAAAGVGMGRREERRFRAPLCGQSARTAAWPRSGPGPSQGRCHCGSRNSRTASGQASQFHHSDRHDSRWRSIGERARCQSGATRRQRHGDEPHGAGPGREAARNLVDNYEVRLSDDSTGQDDCPAR